MSPPGVCLNTSRGQTGITGSWEDEHRGERPSPGTTRAPVITRPAAVPPASTPWPGSHLPGFSSTRPLLRLPCWPPRWVLPAQPRPVEVIGNFSVRGLFLCPHLFICSIIYLYQTHRYLFYTLSYNRILINFLLLDFSRLWPSGALSVGPLSHGHAPSLWEFIRHSFTHRTFLALQARCILYTYFQS